ncbi:MAG: hypothetical protein GY722_14700 [bacterium]|nr:hypothetical protein [bacterium]
MTYQGQLDYADVRSGGQILSGYSLTYGYNGERGEIGRAQITRPGNMDDANCYHYYYDCYHTISRRLLTSETAVGTTQCASLRVADYMGCGGLVTNNWSGTINGIQRKWMREVNYAAGNSDSGSGWKPFAYAQRQLAMGIASFADGSTVLVTHMYYVETELNVTTCGTSGVC